MRIERSQVRHFAGVLLACLVGGGLLLALMCAPVGAASTSSSSSAAGSPVAGAQQMSLDSLVSPSEDALDGGQQSIAVASARHASPAAFVARVRSRTEFAHLDGARAKQVARETFPGLIEERDGGTPALPAGQRIVHYLSGDVAQLSLPRGKHGVIESLTPMAERTRSGHFLPIDLGLGASGDSYVPVNTTVPVEISKQLSGGVRAGADGLSLTPIAASGMLLAGEGAVDGASVLYANTQVDTDTVAKPTIRGIELSAILRSADSPRTLYYRVGLPSGARLVRHRGDDSVQIVSGNTVLGEVVPPSATDSAGDQAPVRMTVKGDVLVLEVGGNPGEYQYPINVDPELLTAEDRSLTGSVWPDEFYREGSAWRPFETYPAFHYNKEYGCNTNPEWCTQSWHWEPFSGYAGGEYAGIQYETQGVSKLYKFEAWVAGQNNINEGNEGTAKTVMEIDNIKGASTNTATLSEGPYYKYEPATICARGAGCAPAEGNERGLARIMDYTTNSGGVYGFSTTVWAARVWVAQEQPPTASFNTTSPTIAGAGGRANVLYGSGSWLSPTQGAYEVSAEDRGLGLSFVAVANIGPPLENFIRTKEGKCLGIQCPQTYSSPLTYLPGMKNGEYSIEMFGEDAAKLDGYVYKTIKVDSEPPYGIGFTGMPEEGAEISAVPHKLTVHATDGVKPSPSSGMKSIAVSIDGGPATILPGASCTMGECTVSGEYTLHAEALTEGVHRLIVTATDNAGNEAPAKEFFFDVRSATPVAVGPGSVDPSTGQFELNASDVSLGGAVGVSRAYRSRNLTAGVEGPLGPQWAMNVGGGESITALPTGTVVLAGAEGGRTTFSPNSKGELQSPKGDGNLKLEFKSAEKKYALKNSTANSETIFEQPAGTENTVPAFANQFGPESAKMNSPTGAAIDSAGNVWITDTLDGSVLKFSQGGAVLARYGSLGSGAGQFNDPRAVAFSPVNKDVYVTDEANNRVVVLNEKGEFQYTFGWGVLNGTQEPQVCKEAYLCKAGIAGAGNGQVKEAHGIAIDSTGNVWVADYGNDRIEEFGSEGQYLQKFGSEGSGEVQFKGPVGVAIDGGNLYVVDYGNNRVEEFSAAGKYLAQFGKYGSGNGEFNAPHFIAAEVGTGDLYVTDTNNKRIEEFTSAGKFITAFGSTGSGPGQFGESKGIAVNAQGWVYAVDTTNNRVEEWARSTWWPTSANTISGKGSPASGAQYFYKAVENSEGKTSIQPIEVLAPTPAEVTCGTKESELKQGCRALTFEYAEATTATGENESEWKSYKGRLKKVSFHGWNPTAKAMEEKAVAEYSYDKQGRLRAEWDPRISPALKTTYGYDVEGHVTALTYPGEESWAFTYGTSAGDSSTSRLLKVAQAPASASLWKSEAPKNTEAPKLSGSAVVGITMGVSKGAWGNSPVSYAYQWVRCNSLGAECTPIEGATNANYTASTKDAGHTLQAVVTAINGGGSIAIATATSGGIKEESQAELESELVKKERVQGEHYGPEPGWTIEYGVPLSGNSELPNMSEGEVAKWGQKNDLPRYAAAVFPPDEPMGWPAKDYRRASLTYLDEEGRTVNTAVPTGGVATTEYNSLNEVVRTLSPDNRAAALKETGKTAEAAELLDTKTEYNSEGTEIEKTVGPQHTVKLASGTEAQARNDTHYYYDENAPKSEEAYNLVTKTTEAALVSGKEEDKRTTLTEYGGQANLGWKLRKPTATVDDPSGLDLVHTTLYDKTTGNVVETQGPAGSPQGFTYQSELSYGEGSEEKQFKEPAGIAVNSSNGDNYVVEPANNRVQEFSPSGEFIRKFGSEGTTEGKFKAPRGIALDASGNVWVADTGNNRVQEFSPEGAYIGKFAGIKGEGSEQLNEPEGIAVAPSGNVYVADTKNNRIVEISSSRVYIAKFGKKGAGSSGEFNEPAGVAVTPGGHVLVLDTGNDRVQELSSSGTYEKQFGSAGDGAGQFSTPRGIAVDSSGYVYVSDTGNNRVEQFSSSGVYKTRFGLEGPGDAQFRSPRGVALGEPGVVLVVDTGNSRVEEWKQGPNARDIKTIYYSAKGEAEVAACQNHPEWASLPCQTKPAVQPSSGIDLPVTTTAYNMWDTPEAEIEEFVHAKREKKQTFDAADRLLTSEVVSSNGKATPKVTYKYNSETGALTEKSTSEGKSESTVATFNKLGQVESYKDADGSTTKYVYEAGGDARLDEVSYEIGSEKFSDLYSYSPTTGLMRELYDTGLKKGFTATYDVEGKMLTEGYPNGMTATTTYNSVGLATGLVYEKTNDCASKCPETWFSDAIVPSIHGEMLKQTSSLAKENYVYDSAGRMLEAEETPTGKGCKARLYSYDEESNRLNETTRESSTETCPTSGGSIQYYEYDSGNHLTDGGVKYEEFSNATYLPSSDAGGHALTSAYYSDGQVATQEQNGEKIEYAYDPEGRARETISKGTANSTVISHYSGSGEALTWTSEEGGKKWTRNIPGIDGALDGIQASSGTPALQLHDLQGNIVGTAGLNETETKLLSTYNSTEFGVPSGSSKPPTYAWLGAGEVGTELAAGTVTKGGASYVPQVARALQAAPVIPPGAVEGLGTTTQVTATISAASLASAQANATKYFEEAEAARQKAEEEEMLRALEEAGEGSDPTTWLTASAAEEKAKKLDEVTNFQEWFDFFGELFDLGQLHITQIFENAVTAKFDGWGTIHEWDVHTAHLLEKCAEEIDGDYYDEEHWKCRVSTTDIFNITVPKIVPFIGGDHVSLLNFKDPAQVAVCMSQSGTCFSVH